MNVANLAKGTSTFGISYGIINAGVTLSLLFLSFISFGARIDTLSIPSAAMNKSYKAVVVLPESYGHNKIAYPVLYLLHGGTGHFDSWLKNTPDKMLVPNLADQYNLIIVMPEGEVFSFYLDSPVNKESQFETYITKEVIDKIDNTYRTMKSSAGRVISGYSMGGHGALYLATRHPDLFSAAGSMSGALDLRTTNWRVAPESQPARKERFEKILGPDDAQPDIYAANSVVEMADRMKINKVKIIFDCGVDDYLLEPNRELHRRLVYNKTPHDYSERPGAHTWTYWQNSLPYHLVFFNNVLKENKVSVVIR